MFFTGNLKILTETELAKNWRNEHKKALTTNDKEFLNFDKLIKYCV